MKNLLFLLLFCLANTFFVSGQTYKKFKSSDGMLTMQKTSNTTAILRYESTDGNVVTKYLTLSKQTGEEKLWTCDNGDYVISKPASIQIGSEFAYEVTIYNALDRKIGSRYVY
jgi:hypothetical protein